MQSYPLDASLTLGEAGPMWLEQHSRDLRPHTIRGYRSAVKCLTSFLGADIQLNEIDVGHIRRYQIERRKRAGPYLLNGEVGVLGMILKEAGLWKHINEFYKPLRAPKRTAGHSLTQEEEARLREVAFTKPKWRLAAHCMTIMLSTTMGFGELSQLRRRDVDMQRKCLQVVDGAKNLYRSRTIPMNGAACESITWILDRWEKLGGTAEDEYILPHRPRSYGGPWIFTEPMTSMKSAFDGIREAAGLPHFRVYDCRVQAITKLLSNPKVSSQVSKEIAGHISQAMQDRYSIQRFDTKKAALDALENPSAEPVNHPPPAPEAPAAVDLMSAAIQAEIARQVVMALGREREQRCATASNVVSFPGPRLA